MKKIFYSNRLFFASLALFYCSSLILYSQLEHGEAIIYFSENRTEFLNRFFRIGTKFGEQYAYLLALLVLLFVKFRYAIMIPVIIVLVALASFGLKDIFLQWRPFDFFQEFGNWTNIEKVSGVELLTGRSSFPSGHSMSAFALFSYLAFVFNKSRLLDFCLFLIALMIALSRIYLVQHFLIDVIAGSFCGVLIGVLVFRLQSLLNVKKMPFLDKKIPLKLKKNVNV